MKQARLRFRGKTANAQAARPSPRRLFDHLFKKLPSLKNLTSAGLYGSPYIGSCTPECKRRRHRFSDGFRQGLEKLSNEFIGVFGLY